MPVSMEERLDTAAGDDESESLTVSPAPGPILAFGNWGQVSSVLPGK